MEVSCIALYMFYYDKNKIPVVSSHTVGPIVVDYPPCAPVAQWLEH